MSRFSVETFFSRSAEKFRREALQGVTNFEVSNKFMLKEGFVTFCRRIFCLAVPKVFAGEPVSAAFRKNSGSETVYR